MSVLIGQRKVISFKEVDIFTNRLKQMLAVSISLKGITVSHDSITSTDHKGMNIFIKSKV